VPGWHDLTKDLQKAGKVRMAGIIQEQHPDRCRLFMQWKQMDWPILTDSFNRLEVAAVPITLLIDEHGVIRKVRARSSDLKTFLETDYPKPTKPLKPTPTSAEIRNKLEGGAIQNNSAAHVASATSKAEWGDLHNLGQAIEAFDALKTGLPKDGWLRFRAGVAYRKRYDSDARQAGDFANAIENWGDALEIDPNQYIWRRRIQQYGPRLDKPYPFYDWVPAARKEITARGETPTSLSVEPGGAEFAKPLKRFAASSDTPSNPDPRKRIAPDKEGFIRIESTSVPSTKGSSPALRVHLVFRPNAENKAHWNNEAEGVIVWIDALNGWQLGRQKQEIPNDAGAVSDKPRSLEIELMGDRGAKNAATTLKGYALYYACEDVDGVCVYRRQDFTVPLK
jgi:tetratricopeptide (TPR) repeat protein